MLPPVKGYAALVSLAFCGMLGATSAWGQTQTVQTLDQVDAFNTKAVLEMTFDDPNTTAAFKNLSIDGKGLAACKLAASGLYCLETDSAGTNQVVRYWKEPQKPTQFVDQLRCDDSGLGPLVGGRPCAGLTVDLQGHIWIVGSKDGINYRLIKVMKQSELTGCTGSAANDWTPLSQPTPTAPLLCAKQYATGAGSLSDLDAIDGEVADAWDAETAAVADILPGILAIENGSVVKYFDMDTAGASATNFGAWSPTLPTGERLLSTALLQVPVGPNDPAVKNYVLATTSDGKVLAKSAVNPGTAAQVYPYPSGTIPPTPVRIAPSTWSACLSQTTCTVTGATLTARVGAAAGSFVTKSLNGATGLGVAGGASGAELDIGEAIDVAFPASRTVTAIQILFLFNGPEFGDKAEVAKVTADGVEYRLSVNNDLDNAAAVWTGPGAVAKCGSTLSSGTGCFLITNPFSAPVTSLTFGAVAGNTPFPGGTGTNDSDYSIGRIETAYYGIRTSKKTGRAYLSDRDSSTVQALRPDAAAFTSLQSLQQLSTLNSPPDGNYPPDGLTVAPGISLDLADCAGTGGCDLIKTSDNTLAAKLSNVTLQTCPAGQDCPTGVTLFQVTKIPDCRYNQKACLDLLGISPDPGAGAPTPEKGTELRMQALIDYRRQLFPGGAGYTDSMGVIVPLDNAFKYSPAAQLLNVTPLLGEDVSSRFDKTGAQPNGLPPLLISRQYRAQKIKGFLFDAFFARTETGVGFVGTFDGEYDVKKLTGTELGCLPKTGSTGSTKLLREWDVVTTVSERYFSAGGVGIAGASAATSYIDTLTNVGCGTTATRVGRLSLIPYDLEVAPDTYGPTVRKTTGNIPIVDVTLNNDGLFGRLLQSLYTDLRTALDGYTCPTVLNTTTCDRLRTAWNAGKPKLDDCVNAAFQPKASASNQNCQSFRIKLDDYRAALPATASGDTANRLAEQKYRWEVIKHVFETKFLPSIPEKKGFCRELYPAGTTACPNTPL